MTDPITIQRTLKEIDFVQSYLHGQPCEFHIWPAQELKKLNEAYEVSEALPGYFAIGSDGGLEMLTIELATGTVYAIPFIPMEVESRIWVAASLEELLKGT